MKSIFRFLFLLLILSGCSVANKLEWGQTDASVVSRVKNNPTSPDLYINFARCEEDLTIFPFFFIWDNKRTGYSLSLIISTGTDIYQKLDSIGYEIFTNDSILTKG